MPFFWIRFICLTSTEPLKGDSLLFNSKFPDIPGIHLIDLQWMKDQVNLRAIQWF